MPVAIELLWCKANIKNFLFKIFSFKNRGLVGPFLL